MIRAGKAAVEPERAVDTNELLERISRQVAAVSLRLASDDPVGALEHVRCIRALGDLLGRECIRRMLQQKDGAE